ncbi:MAG: aminotransferase class V-fold PLP-dependent enzyme, partial [Pirellulales bacterium]|nr:aminotransferase class V-fold PLP-dependent enzyme [Pirellulales bacterium]
APKGVGALFVRHGIALEPLIHGAGHEGGLRSGTQNVGNIVALGHACSLVEKEMPDAAGRMAALRDRMADHLVEAVGAALGINAAKAPRLPTRLSVNFPEANAQRLLKRLPELCAATGAAGNDEPENFSPTLAAIGLPPNVACGTIRLSLGWYTTEEDVDRAANLLLTAWDGVRL